MTKFDLRPQDPFYDKIALVSRRKMVILLVQRERTSNETQPDNFKLLNNMCWFSFFGFTGNLSLLDMIVFCRIWRNPVHGCCERSSFSG